MKKIFACLIFVVFLATPALCFQNSPDGFRGVKWGDPPSVMGEYTLETKEDDYLKIYSRHGDKMSIGDVPLTKLYYMFCVERLAGLAATLSANYFTDMKQILIVQYGEPMQQNRYIPKYTWIDNNAFIVFENIRGKGYCELRIHSVPEVKLMDKVQKEKAQKASGDF